ncbi:MAG: alpha-amylase family glycosyl hydrolase [Nocardioides sp.]|uniref:alpha-amylase family glycosyl hydrolase n=1 Tax=Nocardioides sp. TaxID=35761 RepID=UPI0039E44CEA
MRCTCAPSPTATATASGIWAACGAHLDDLANLGVDALWLCPIHPSPRADGGYDVADYCDVADEYGGLDALDALIAEAHRRGMRVILDWVPNHTSDRHPWFLASAASRDSPDRDLYVWRDAPANHWRAAWDGPAWTWHQPSGQWFLSCFTPRQPELDWGNPVVVARMHQTLRFWLARGVDGFRVDVVHMLAKDPDLADTPADLAGEPHVMVNHHEGVFPVLTGLRAVLAEYGEDRLLLGEVSLMETATSARYLGPGRLHLGFDFVPMFQPWSARAWRTAIAAVQRHTAAAGGWPTWTFGNHDNPRQVTRYGSAARARVVAVATLTLHGTPVLYAGEELGLSDAQVPAESVEDAAGRDGCRAVLPWLPDPGHGWVDRPWQVMAPEAGRLNRRTQHQDPGSMLSLYRELIRLRRRTPALRRGEMVLRESAPGTVAWERVADGERWLVVLGMDLAEPAGVGVPGDWEVVVSTSGEPGSWDGTVAPDTALVLTTSAALDALASARAQ